MERLHGDDERLHRDGEITQRLHRDDGEMMERLHRDDREITQR